MAICEYCDREFDTTNRSNEDWFQLSNHYPGKTGKNDDMPTVVSESWNYCSYYCLHADVAGVKLEKEI